MRVAVYDPEALKSLKRMPRNVSNRIRAKVAQLAADPNSLANNLIAMKGTRALRLRVGD
jgi:mRNA interferase RelE/StbE